MAFFLKPSDPGHNVTVSKEELNLFHNIDRQLFIRLVVGLGRDTSQSTHVMAFIMWLEKVTKNFKLVQNLLQWPNNMLESLANEVILVLNSVESARFPHVYDNNNDNDNNNNLPLIQNIFGYSASVSLQYFHEKRLQVIPAITSLLNDVCIRAFMDIVQQVQHMKAMKGRIYHIGNIQGTVPLVNNNPYVLHVALTPPRDAMETSQNIVGSLPQWNDEGSSRSPSRGGDSGRGGNFPIDRCDVKDKKNLYNEKYKEILDKLSRTSINDSSERKEVPIDDRTIFMTFSKGYPISEGEILEFFTRKYGDVIESLHMQDVHRMEQPLYARLVVRSNVVNMIDHLLDGNEKAKFFINGKHVCARRYIRKDTNTSNHRHHR